MTLPQTEIDALDNVMVPMTSRDMSNAPKYLYNLYLTYDFDRIGTEFGIFYTYKGDTLVTGAGTDKGHFVPNVYEEGYGTLNFSVSKKLELGKLVFQMRIY